MTASARALTQTLLAAVALAVLAGRTGAQGLPALPQGAGLEVVQSRCLSCHGDDLIQGQRLTTTGWTREVEKMVRWGARVTDAEKAPLVAYLAAHFGVRPAASPVTASAATVASASASTAADGEAVFSRSCLGCHGRDLTEGQRLTTTGWTREVEKMMRWGAKVDEADKAALVAWLAATYPVR
jgi:mono/diheme cytochrome c family protein